MDNAIAHKDPSACLESVPAHLRIKFLHIDTSIIVIEKPCNLRSVPGHAHPPPPENAKFRSKKRPKRTIEDTQSFMSSSMDESIDSGSKKTAQEAWVDAIQSYERDADMGDISASTRNCELINHDSVRRLTSRLAKTSNVSSIPRKWKLFWRYMQRNRQRLMDGETTDLEKEALVKHVYDLIKKRQERLMNLPAPSPHEESAFGQLILMGYAANARDPSNEMRPTGIYVVHRLDCETSGVMVFARAETVASILCEEWRTRHKVEKVYLARVQSWPPFHDNHQNEGHIDLPLGPSIERLKWEVRTDGGGKQSMTKWKVRGGKDRESSSPVLLELTPITGRTHQLRIHCAAVGSGICGDSLYGNNRIEWHGHRSSLDAATTLSLHAHMLKFPHPETGETVQFVSPPTWDH